MAKYRLLTQAELHSLEKEFVEYLVINGITATDWVKMKENQPAEAEQVIELFSDVVFEGVLRKLAFLEHITPHHLRTFQCLPEKIVLVAMEAKADEKVDFTDPAFIKLAMTSPPASLKIYTTQKAYKSSRETELFEMTENGCLISDGKLFKTLSMLLTRNN